MKKTNMLSVLAFISLLIACANPKEETSKVNNQAIAEEANTHVTNSTNKVVPSSAIEWGKLNPARGDQSPKAGDIWGDRKKDIATGFLVKFADGFSSPPHIHNVTYRAIVLKGLIHNDDPKAEKMWMPVGSFWTQPAGELHITAARGAENMAYVEIDSGPYLVKPVEEAFDNGERPINIDKSNLVWLDATKLSKVAEGTSSLEAKVAFLWEKGNFNGSFIKLSAGFKGAIMSKGKEFRAVIISGVANYLFSNSEKREQLDPGSYFTATSQAIHQIEVNQNNEMIIYVRTNGSFEIQ